MFLFRRISMLMLLLVSCFAVLQADFVTLSIWRRITPKGKEQFVVCCGGIRNLHDKADEQAQDIAQFLVERKNPADCVLIEREHSLSGGISQHMQACLNKYSGYKRINFHLQLPAMGAGPDMYNPDPSRVSILNLLDAHFLYNMFLHTQPHKNGVLFVCAAIGHAFDIEQIFSHLGYRPIYSTGALLHCVAPVDVKRAVNSCVPLYARAKQDTLKAKL